MNKTALQLAYDLINISQEISELCTQKAYATTNKEDDILDKKIDVLEREFHEIKDILDKINI